MRHFCRGLCTALFLQAADSVPERTSIVTHGTTHGMFAHNAGARSPSSHVGGFIVCGNGHDCRQANTLLIKTARDTVAIKVGGTPTTDS